MRAVEKRALLLAFWKKRPRGSYAAARRYANCSFEMAKLWLDRFRAGDTSLADVTPPGRPAKLSATEARYVKRKARNKKRPTIEEITDALNQKRGKGRQLSASTVYRATKGLKFKDKQHKKVSKTNELLRKKATTLKKIKGMKKVLHRTVFSDASYVRFAPGQFIRPHRFDKGWELPGLPDRPYDPTKFKLACFYAGIALTDDGSMLCSRLNFVPPTPDVPGSLNGPFYSRKVVPELERFGQTVFGEEEWWLLQDNAPPHRARATLRSIATRSILLHDHVAQSPDMNPIEKCWAVFKPRVARRRPQSWERFKAVMQEEWRIAVQIVGAKAIEALPAVMQQVHREPGVHVKNLKVDV